MESSGRWDDTTIVITSDHGYRPEIWNGTPGDTQEMRDAVGGSKSLTVPVLIHFPHQKTALRYAPEFNNALLHDLVLAVLRSEVRDPEQAAQWLDSNRGRLPTSPPQPVP